MAITSAIRFGKKICHSKLGNNISQCNIINNKNGLTSAIKIIELIICPIKLYGISTLIHHFVLENNLVEHFSQTRRSHDRNLAKACLPAIN